MQKIQVEIISDVVCPWCYIGLAHFRRAVAQLEGLAPGFSQFLEVRWSPFQLNPRMPESGMPRRDYLVAKFGEAGLAGYAQIADHAQAAGIPMHLDRIAVQPNTERIHALVMASGELAHPLMDRLFTAFFVDGEDLTQEGVLIRLATSVGFEESHARAALQDKILAKRVYAICDEWRNQGVNGVPTFRLSRGAERLRVLNGAVRPEVFVKTFQELLA